MTRKPKKPTRPGTTLMQFGLLIAAIGVFLAILAAGSTSTDLYGVTTHGDASRGLLFALFGLVLAGIGFGRRLLAALENRSEATTKAEESAQ